MDKPDVVIGVSGNNESYNKAIISMIHFVYGQGVTKANYKDWLVKRPTNDLYLNGKVIDFDTCAAKALAHILGVDEIYFTDVMYRKYYYDFKHCRMISPIYDMNNYYIIKPTELNNNTISKIISRRQNSIAAANSSGELVNIETLIHYFEHHAEDLFYKYICYDNTMRLATEIAAKQRICFIENVTQDDQAQFIVRNRAYNFHIYVEDMNTIVPYFIGSYPISIEKVNLSAFYKVLEFVKHIIK